MKRFTGKTGLDLIKEPDGSILDAPSFFDMLLGIHNDRIIEFPSEMDKWFRMDINRINDFETFQILPINWRIEILQSIIVDSRFEGNKSVFENEIIKLLKLEENQIRNNFYGEIFDLALKSKYEAIENIHTFSTETNKSIIQSGNATGIISQTRIKLLKQRILFLHELEVWVPVTNFAEFKINNGTEEDKQLELNNDIGKEEIEPNKISVLANGIPAKLVLLYELDLYEVIKERATENNSSRKDKARIISYIINETNADNVNDYLSMDLNPFYTNYNDQRRDNPFSSASIKEMKRILRDCNWEPKKEYPELRKPGRPKLKSKKTKTKPTRTKL